MSRKTFCFVSSVVFLLLAIGQLTRFLMGVSVVVANSFAVPTWASAIAFVIFGYLAIAGYRASRSML